MGSNVSTITRKNYACIDLFRLIASILVVIIHCADNYNDTSAVFISATVSQLAVPFFFIVSGYFFKGGLDRSNDKKEYFCKYVKHTFLLYIFWAVVSLPYTVGTYIEIYGKSVSIIEFVLILLRRIFFAGSNVYWYILAMAESAVAIYFIDKFKLKKVLILLIVVGLSLNVIYNSVPFLGEVSPAFALINKLFYTVFSWSNNFIMCGIPFMGIGYLFAIKTPQIKVYACYIILFLATVLNMIDYNLFRLTGIEYFKSNKIGVFFIVQAIMFFLIALKTDLKIKYDVQIVLRELSSAIYFLHFITLYVVVYNFISIETFFVIKALILIAISSLVYVIVKLTNIKLLKFGFNIKN